MIIDLEIRKRVRWLRLRRRKECGRNDEEGKKEKVVMMVKRDFFQHWNEERENIES